MHKIVTKGRKRGEDFLHLNTKIIKNIGINNGNVICDGKPHTTMSDSTQVLGKNCSCIVFKQC